MEDINIGRRVVAATRSVLLPSGSAFDIPANGSRIGLLLSGNSSGAINVFRGIGNPATTDEAANRFFLDIPAALPYLMMRIEQYGQAVQLSYAMSNATAGSVRVAYTEFILVP